MHGKNGFSYKDFILKDFVLPSDPTLAQIEMEQDARTQFFSLIAQGGCGIAPNSAVEIGRAHV